MKKIFSVLILVAFVGVLPVAIFAQEKAQDRIENGVLYIADGTVDIAYAKYRRNAEITTVVFPASVRRIGYEAFRECPNLETIEISANIAIVDSWAFAKCAKLSNVTIANGVTSINEYAFYGCDALKSVEIPGTVSVIGKWAFGKCPGLTSVLLNNGVLTVIECAFYGCDNLEYIEVPESVSSIGRFFPPKTVIRGIAGSYAQKFAEEKKIAFEAVGYTDDYVSSIKYLDLSAKTEIADAEFKNFNALKKVTLSPNLTRIGAEAFAFCPIKKIEIPERVNFIGGNAFQKTVVVKCKKGSYAETWARRNNMKIETKTAIGVSVDVPTQEEIAQFMTRNRFYTDAESQGEPYDVAPTFVAPHFEGEVNSKIQKGALAALNTVRYLAGLNTVTLSEDYSRAAQSAAYVNALSGTLSRKPKQASGVDNDLYAAALDGAAKSNLAKGPESLPLAVLRLVHDAVPADTSRESLIHRRWILNPAMAKTGFGAVDKVYAQYIGDFSEEVTADTNVVVWPPQNMPLEIASAKDAYSILLGDGFTVADNLNVKMTRSGDGRTWNFSKINSDGYFRVADGGNSVHKKYIAWLPADITDYMAGDRVSIEVDGVLYNGKSYPISYNVDYFNALPIDIIDNGRLTVAQGSTNVPRGKYKGNEEIRYITFPESVKKIGKEAFRELKAIDNLIIPGTVKEIDEWAFAKCAKLKTVDIEDGVEKIGECAFYGCDALEKINIPTSVTSIGNYFPKKAVIRCEQGSFAEFYASRNKIPYELVKPAKPLFDGK